MDSDANDLNSRNRLRWGNNYKVYTRKRRRKTLENTNTDVTPAAAATATVSSAVAVPEVTSNENDDLRQPSLQTLDAERAKSPEQQRQHKHEAAAEDVPDGGGGGGGSTGGVVVVSSGGEVPEGSSGSQPATQNHRDERQSCNLEVENGYVKPMISRIQDRIRINLTGVRSRDEIRELSMSLESELDQVRSLVKELEVKRLQLTTYRTSINGGSINAGGVTTVPGGSISSYSHPQYMDNGVINNRSLARMNSEVRSAGHVGSRPYQQPSFLIVENSNGSSDFMEKEKRTPKANQYYRNSEFLLGKDRLPPESNKRLKPNGSGKKQSADSENGFAFGYGFDKHRLQVFRNCSSLLQRLMKHQHGWVFNEPVNPKSLGLHDYHDIIKHPMDLGTIKSRLSQNWYKSPREFAEDVRLVFHNAMTYNPKGQDVHVMAEHLSEIFEERWAVIEAEYNSDWRRQTYHDGNIPTPTSRMTSYAPSFPHTPVASRSLASHQLQTLDRSESMTRPVGPKMKTSSIVHVARTPIPKKPKAKDPNKRDMTYEEKQKLSTNLQSLPSEKLDAIVQIIKKRNSALSQDNDEIEVDIDSVDAETLWELDRFVTNFKKSFSKYKRKAELALRAKEGAAQTARIVNPTSVVADALKENGTVGEKDTTPATLTEGGRPVHSPSRSSSSSSSSSDSGSSSSDSDSDSSSASGSEAAHSPRT